MYAGNAFGAAPDAAVWAELAKTHHLSAEFTQTQKRAILKKPLVSSGTIEFERPENLVWTVKLPAPSTFELHGSVASMEFPQLGLKERFDLDSMPDANRLASSLLVWLQADPAAVERDFTVHYLDAPARIVLTPKSPSLQGLIKKMELHVKESPWRISGVNLEEPSGDTVDLAFHRVILDGKPIPDAP